ncbi:MAG: phage holin family protein [Verrucomicrobiales bacterium]|nr:phage holin family protein [Verrucomicrobiales bacterium]
MEGAPPTEGGLLSTVTQMFQRLRDLAENRVELFLIELKEERAKMFDTLLLAAAGIVCALMTLVMVTLTVLVIFWDTHRVLVLTLVTAAYAVAATVAFVKLRSRLQRWQAYSATLEEFKKDCACFKKPN